MNMFTKKTAAKRGLSIHDGAGSAVSSFARKQMEKMGWTEGKGLGKNEDGSKSHIKVSKKDDSAGLGVDTAAKEEIAVAENWWHDGFSKQLKAFGGGVANGKKVKKTKSKKNLENDDHHTSAPPTYDELFAATGGARLGMRARAKQTGKIARAELGMTTSMVEVKEVENEDDCSLKKKKEGKKEKRKKNEVLDDDDDIDDERRKQKKKNKKQKKEMTDSHDNVESADPDTVKKKKSKKKVKEASN